MTVVLTRVVVVMTFPEPTTSLNNFFKPSARKRISLCWHTHQSRVVVYSFKQLSNNHQARLLTNSPRRRSEPYDIVGHRDHKLVIVLRWN